MGFSSAPRRDGADGADGKGVRTPRSLSRRDLLRAEAAMPFICAAWSVASCSAPVSRGDAEPTTSAPVSPTPETSALEFAARGRREALLQRGGPVTEGWACRESCGRLIRTRRRSPSPSTPAAGRKARVSTALLATLQELAVPVTLFWNKRWIDANPDWTRQIAVNPLFQIENHGTLRKPLSVNGRSAYGIAGTACSCLSVLHLKPTQQTTYIPNALNAPRICFSASKIAIS